MRESLKVWLRLIDVQVEGNKDSIKHMRREIRAKQEVNKALKAEQRNAIRSELK